MAGSIEENAWRVLAVLAEYQQQPGDTMKGRYNLSAKEIAEATGLSPGELDDAVQHLEDAGTTEVTRVFGTAPYAFKDAELTKDGRLAYERSKKQPPPRPAAAASGAQAGRIGQSSGTSLTEAEVQELRTSLKDHGWYLTTEKLGEGGGGVTFLAARVAALDQVRGAVDALDEDDDEAQQGAAALLLTARKVLAPGTDELGVFKYAKQANERMKREIKALSTLKHENLVRIFAADPTEVPAWYVMEYFENGDLTHRWAHYEGRAREVLVLVRQLANALKVVHAAKLVHRDIKPDNIFIGHDGRWVLGDFGIAFEAGATRHTEAGPTPMTKEWRPDWVVSRRLEDFPPTVDIFMLAKVAYAMIAGPGRNPPASQLQTGDFDLRRLHPKMPHVEAMQQFILDHVVAHEDAIKSKTADDFIARIDELIARFEWRKSEHLVFSFVSSHSTTHVNEGDLRSLQNVDIRLPEGTTRLHFATRLLRGKKTEMADHISYEVWPRHGGAKDVWTKGSSIHVHDSDAFGHWLTDEIPITPRTAGGWYRFAIGKLFGGLMITGLTITAEAEG